MSRTTSLTQIPYQNRGQQGRPGEGQEGTDGHDQKDGEQEGEGSDHREQVPQTTNRTQGRAYKEDLQGFANVQISFPDLGVKSDIVKIRSPTKDVDDCGKLVNDMAESSFQVKVPIFKQFHKYIIGKGGANIRRIRDETPA